MSESVPTDRAALEKDISETRDRLSATADALAAKADVKGQAQAKVEDLKATAQHKAEDVRAQAAATVDRASHRVQDASAGAPGTAQQQRGVLLGAIVAATALAVWLIVRKR